MNPPTSFFSKKNEPYEKTCDKCGNRIIMNHSNRSGKWYAVNMLDGSYHRCGLNKEKNESEVE